VEVQQVDLLDLLVGDLLEVDVLLEEDDLQVEELLEAHNLLGMGTVDIDGVELRILGVGAGLHREVLLQDVGNNLDPILEEVDNLRELDPVEAHDVHPDDLAVHTHAPDAAVQDDEVLDVDLAKENSK
jgi:hypothetical protein